MAERQRGMGRGLAAILSVVPRDEEEEFRELPVELIAPNPAQPRRGFDEQALLALAESIRARGVLQPVLVRPVVGGRYELIAGERRWRAARMAELDSIPAIVRHQDDAASLVKRKMVVERKRSPGRRNAEGNLGWFGASGKAWVSKQKPSLCR